MLKALKNNKIIAINETGSFPCLVYDEKVEDTEHTVDDYEQINGEYVLKQNVSIDYRNEQIRQQRQSRFASESDPLYLDYVEAKERNDESANDKKKLWLDKKDEIRKDLPYLSE